MASINTLPLPLALLAAALGASCASLNGASSGTPDRLAIEFEDNGYLKQALVDPVRDEQLRAQAISAHEYALPIVGLERWRAGFLKEAEYGDWLIYEERDQKIPILTANTTTPYVLTFLDLSEGNYYLDLPAGPIGGMIIDIYQAPQADLGVVGPDQGKGGRYLVVGPESVVPEEHDADFVVSSSSNLVFIGSRIIGLEGDAYKAVLNGHQIHAVGAKPGGQKFIDATSSPTWMGDQSQGMEYWQDLNRVLQNEPVVDRNRFILTQLRRLGMEKGQPFEPDERQTRLLTEAAEIGNAAAMVNSFSRDAVKEKHWPDRRWLYVLNMNITVYDNDTRTLIQNDQGKSDVSSVQSGLKVEPDGSTKVFVGGSPPAGYENNWIESNPEKGFFVYLRLYGPLEPYFDRSWTMPDVKRVD